MSKNNTNFFDFILNLPINSEFQVKIESDSMSPLFLIGDDVLVKKTEFTRSKTGDIICFYSEFQKSLIIHRLLKKCYSKNTSNYEFITKGDALQKADPNALTKENFVGLVVSKIKIDKKTNLFNKMIFISIQRIFLRFKLNRNFFYQTFF